MATTYSNMKEWWVDGHFIAASGARAALNEAARLYEFTPESVRPWTEEDQAELDFESIPASEIATGDKIDLEKAWADSVPYGEFNPYEYELFEVAEVTREGEYVVVLTSTEDAVFSLPITYRVLRERN